MRRMKDMSQIQAGMSFYGELPDSLNVVVNNAHPLVKRVMDRKDKTLGTALEKIKTEIAGYKSEINKLEEAKKDKKDEEIPQADKEKLDELNKKVSDLEEQKRTRLADFGKKNKHAKQLVDLALLANGMLKGADLDKFVKRSVELIR